MRDILHKKSCNHSKMVTANKSITEEGVRIFSIIYSHIDMNDLIYLEQILTHVASTPHVNKQHFIRSLQNRIADIHFANEFHTSELHDKLVAASFAELDRWIDYFIELGLPIPTTLIEVREDKLRKESDLLLEKLISGEIQPKTVNK